MDELSSKEEAASAFVVVERRRADPMLHALAIAAGDDELSNPQEDESARQALAAYERAELLTPSEL